MDNAASFNKRPPFAGMSVKYEPRNASNISQDIHATALLPAILSTATNGGHAYVKTSNTSSVKPVKPLDLRFGSRKADSIDLRHAIPQMNAAMNRSDSPAIYNSQLIPFHPTGIRSKPIALNGLPELTHVEGQSPIHDTISIPPVPKHIAGVYLPPMRTQTVPDLDARASNFNMVAPVLSQKPAVRNGRSLNAIPLTLAQKPGNEVAFGLPLSRASGSSIFLGKSRYQPHSHDLPPRLSVASFFSPTDASRKSRITKSSRSSKRTMCRQIARQIDPKSLHIKPNMTAEEKHQVRAERNRLSAMKSREKSSKLAQELEDSVRRCRAEIEVWRKEVGNLRSYIASILLEAKKRGDEDRCSEASELETALGKLIKRNSWTFRASNVKVIELKLAK